MNEEQNIQEITIGETGSGKCLQIMGQNPFQKVTTEMLMKALEGYKPDDEWYVLLYPLRKPPVPQGKNDIRKSEENGNDTDNPVS